MSDPARDEVLDFLHRCKDEVRALSQGNVEIKIADAFVASLFWRAVRLFA